MKIRFHEYMRNIRARNRNKYIQTETELTQEEEQRQKELLDTYGHKFQKASKDSIDQVYLGNMNFIGVSTGESNEIRYKPKPPNLELFPPTIHEEGDIFDSLATPSPKEKVKVKKKSNPCKNIPFKTFLAQRKKDTSVSTYTKAPK